jgi:hypothetical protein
MGNDHFHQIYISKGDKKIEEFKHLRKFFLDKIIGYL